MHRSGKVSKRNLPNDNPNWVEQLIQMQAKARQTRNSLHSNNGMYLKLQLNSYSYRFECQGIPIVTWWSLWESKKLSQNDQWKYQAEGFHVHSGKGGEKILVRTQKERLEIVSQVYFAEVFTHILFKNWYFALEMPI